MVEHADRKPTDAYLALMGLAPRRIPHWEHLSNPAFEQLVTGVDPWQKPRTVRLKLREIYQIDLGGGVPAEDKPIARPAADGVHADEDGRLRTRWGTGATSYWDWGRDFHSIEQVLSYQPLEHLDLRNANVVENRDYSVSEEELYQHYGGGEGPQKPPEGEIRSAGFYNTLFMWPLLTFGWELFLELGASYEEECKRLLADFACLSRKAFEAWALTDIEVVVSHDDICFQAGPVFRPEWLRKTVYPYYEEFWAVLHAAGKKVIFMCDGNVDQVADDVFACGADGIVSEPFTNWPEIARKHPDKVLAGDGDNRIMATGDREAIFAMVRKMSEWGKAYPGYFFCVGNHIPWDLPAEGVVAYFEAAREYGGR